MIEYRAGNDLDLDHVIELYQASTLGERRPIHDRERFGAMLKNANLVITAWDGPSLVGISRCVTDFSYFTYLSDLAVRVSHQKRGKGKELIHHTQVHIGPKTTILLLAAPPAQHTYSHLDFTHAPPASLLT